MAVSFAGLPDAVFLMRGYIHGHFIFRLLVVFDSLRLTPGALALCLLYISPLVPVFLIHFIFEEFAVLRTLPKWISKTYPIIRNSLRAPVGFDGYSIAVGSNVPSNLITGLRFFVPRNIFGP